MASAALQWLMLPVLALLVLFSARTFSLMHDCGHNSLWSSSWLNRVTGFLLGCLNAVPQYPWSRGHAYHHKHNGNWDLYRGPSSLLSVDQFLELPPGAQRRYAITRHPLMLFPGGFFYLVVRPRLQLLLGLVELASAVIAELWRSPLKGRAAWRTFFQELSIESLVHLGGIPGSSPQQRGCLEQLVVDGPLAWRGPVLGLLQPGDVLLSCHLHLCVFRAAQLPGLLCQWE